MAESDYFTLETMVEVLYLLVLDAIAQVILLCYWIICSKVFCHVFGCMNYAPVPSILCVIAYAISCPFEDVFMAYMLLSYVWMMLSRLSYSVLNIIA